MKDFIREQKRKMKLHEISKIVNGSDSVTISLRTLIKFRHFHIRNGELCQIVCLMSSFLCGFWRSEGFIHVGIG